MLLRVKNLMLLLVVGLCEVDIIMSKLVLIFVIRKVVVGVGMMFVLSMLMFEFVSLVVIVVVMNLLDICGLCVNIVCGCLFCVWSLLV